MNLFNKILVLILFLVLFISNRPSNYFEYLFLIPSVYLILINVFNPFRSASNFWGFYILNVVLFFRYYVVPIFSIYSELYFHTFIVPSDRFSSELSIFIIIYEMVLIFCLQNFFLKKLNLYTFYFKNKVFQFSNFHFMVLFVFGILGFVFIFSFPSISERLNFIQVSSFETSNLNTIYFTLFLISSVSFIVIFLAFVNLQVMNKMKNKKVNYFFILIFSFFAISFFFTTNRLTIVATTISIIFILIKNDLISKKYVLLLVSICLVSVLSLSFYRWFEVGSVVESNENAIEYLTLTQMSNYLQAYFAGHHLISAAIEIDYDLSFQSKFSSFLEEIFNSVIYLRQLFPLNSSNSTVVYNRIFGFIDGNSMILPTLAQSYMYFGLFFSPLLSCLFLSMLYLAEKNVINAKTISLQFAFILLAVWWAFFPMQNMNIVVTSFFFKFLPLYLIVKISSLKFIINR